MSIELLSLIFFASIFAVIFLGLPIAFVLGGVSLVFIFYTWGPAAMYVVVTQTWEAMNQFILVAIPLFILMAMILERAGLADQLYDMMYLWFGPVRGGLAVGTVIICTIFAAMCGISGTATVTMTAIALPSMLKRGYDKSLAIGCINSGGGWGILMPPSTDMIIYALIAGESVGRLFAGGVLPTILLLSLDTTYILVRSYFQAHLAPALPPEERVGWREKLNSLKALILPFVVIVIVLGSILSGFTTPTEAAAMGVLGAVLSALVNRKLTWKLLMQAAGRTFRIMWIIFGAYSFSSAFQGMGGNQLVVDLAQYIPAGKYGAVVFFQFVIFIMAMALNPTTIMMITLPVFLPVIKALGCSTVWYGVLFIINLEIGYMTPPFGYNLFYMKAAVPPGITMGDIYRSVIYFVMVESVGLALVIIFPQIATWLPDLIFG
jgi:tripartite ATP-independent transporter DctM subunit